MNQWTPIRKTRHLSGAQKAAILFLCLGEERGGALMQQLEEVEIRQITIAISTMGDVQADLVDVIMDEFGEKVAQYGGVSGSVKAARGILKEFLSEERVSEILEEIENNETSNVWAEMAKLDENLIADFLRKEHNQTIAVVLSRLKADTASKVLPLLGQERAVDLIERMIAMQSLPRETLHNIENSLRREVLAKAGRNSEAKLEKHLVAMFNKLDDKVFTGIARELEKKVPDQFKAIKQKMFVFDDLAKLPSTALAKVFREVSAKTLPLALRGADKDVRDYFLSSLPARSRDMLQEEMQSMGPVKSRDVKQAQSELVEAAQQLASGGDIELPTEDDEEMIE